ncbi:hypothetical protein LJB42_002023 [Komagataella kurtzmanii]|nr:hypothetical protein LJB42_002023 [Komagataella kurtzmanii]
MSNGYDARSISNSPSQIEESSDIGSNLLRQRRLMKQAYEKFQFKSRKLGYLHNVYSRVLLLLGILQVIGIIFFTKGFLLSRTVLPNIASCENGDCFKASSFNKTVLLVIDALRFDFVIPVEESPMMYHNKLTTLYDLSINEPENSLLLKFIADPPTTTLQRLKGLTTGSLPTFVDAGSNFDGDTIDEDNWVSQLKSHNRNVAFVGDDTWTAMFNPFIYQNLSYPYESLNVWDLHTVDNGVIEHLLPIINEYNDWDFLIGHFLGVDHCGHRHGPNHFAMAEKLIQMDQVINQVMDSIDDETLLIIIGDHGMDETGNHGGESTDEVESTLFMYSKKPFFGRFQTPNAYDIQDKGSNYRWVNQIDLVPSISMLTGIPIPFNNLGQPIEECFTGPSHTPLDLASANYYTTNQINNYRQNSETLKDDSQVNDLFQDIQSMWNSITLDSNTSALNEKCVEYQKISLERCKDLWARFDMLGIGIGIGIIAASLVITVVYSKLVPSVVIPQLNEQMFTSSLALIFVYLVVMASIHLILKPENLSLTMALALGVAIGIINGTLAPIMDRYSLQWLIGKLIELLHWDFWTYLGLLLITLHSLIFTSNSFIIWEDKICSFFLLTFGVCALFASFRLNTALKRLITSYHALSFIISTRMVSVITLCREEQQPKCNTTFGKSLWAIFMLFLASYFVPATIKGFYNISSSYQGAAPLWIDKGMRYSIFVIGVYWALDYIENNDYLNKSLDIPFPILASIKFTISRLIFGITMVAANIGWLMGPLCVKINVMNEQNKEQGPKEVKILGYGNVYGSSYFLLIANFTCAILLFNKPLGALSICVLVHQILTLLELANLLRIRTNLISIVVLILLSYLHFFTTGHQATLQAIHWETGFMMTEKITFPFTHIGIIFNTLGPFIIVYLSVPLLVLWKIPPTNKPISLIGKVAENCTALSAYQTCLTLSTLIMTANFRRHLMVWKIFAPRFMLNGILTILLNVVVFGVGFYIALGRIVRKINNIFGK